MSTNVLNKEERSALANRIGLVKKRKAEPEAPRISAPVKPSAPLRSILTNGTSARLPTPPDSSPSSASPPENKRKRQEESDPMSSMSKKSKQSHEHPNIEESNTNKRKHSQDADEIDLTSPRKKTNNTQQHRPILPQKSPRSSTATNTLHITSPTHTPPINASSRKPHYTPTNPPPNMKFTGIRWNPQIQAWDSKFTPLPTPPPVTDISTPIYRPRNPYYPFGLNPKHPRDPTNLRTVALPYDASLNNRWRDRLAEMDEDEGGMDGGRAQQWEWEIDGDEEEGEQVVVVEGKEEGGRESPETRLDAAKAEELRARAARRGRRSS